MDWTSIGLVVDGTDYTDYLYNGAEQVATLPYGPEIGRATFTLRDDGDMPAINEWSEVVLTANSITVWGGFVTRLTTEPQSISGGTGRITTLDCQSYAILLLTAERISDIFGGGTKNGYDLLTNDYQVVDEIINTYLNEVYDAGSISSTSPVDTQYIAFSYETLRGALNKIVERSRKEFGIAPDKKFYYRPAGSLATYSYALSDNPNNTSTFPMKIKPVYDVDAIDLRNSVVVIGGWTLSEYVVETFTGDAIETIFVVQYRPESVKSVFVDGIAQSVGVDFVDDPSEYDVLVNWDRQWFRFTYPPQAGAQIVIRYRYPVRITYTSQNAGSIAAIGRELWGDTIEDTTISSIKQAKQVGVAYLARVSAAVDRAQVTTNYSTVSGLPWEPGGTVLVTAASLGWSSKAMKIESVTMRAQSRPGGSGSCLVYWDLNLGSQSTLGKTSGSTSYKNSPTYDVRPSTHVPTIMSREQSIATTDFLLRNDGVSGNFQALDGTLIYVIDGQIVAIGPATSVASNQHSCMTAAILGGVFTGSVYEHAKYFLSGKV